jgi:hypothetical protein
MIKFTSPLIALVVALILPEAPIVPVKPRTVVAPEKVTTCHLVTVDGCWSR